MEENTPPLEIQALIEGPLQVNKKGKEGARIQMRVSFPLRGAAHIHTFLAENIGNPVKLGLQTIQARLPENPEGELVNMEVNGEPALVERPKRRGRNGGTPTAEEPTNSAEKPLPHPFKASDRDNQCALCHLGEDNELHVSELAATLIEEARRAPADEDEARDQSEAEARLAHRS